MEKPHDASPILYSFRRCPYAIRARLALAISGVRCELREVALRDKPKALIAASAKGTVPVLMLGDRVIDESLDIMYWALRRHDPEGWLSGIEEPQRSLEIITKCDENFKFHMDRYKYAARFPMEDGMLHRHLASLFLIDLNRQLGAGDYLGGAHRVLADVAIAPFVRQFAQTDPHWFAVQPWPRLVAWLARFNEWLLFHAVMEKYPPWHPEDPPVFLAVDR